MHFAPGAFDSKARPWIRPERGARERLVEVVRQCPTGAPQSRLADGRNPEVPDANSTATLAPDGLIRLRGRIRYTSAEGAEWEQHTRVALCRYWHSGNKPFCDGKHKKIGFAG